ncbi:hypothetical protein GR28A_00090 [Vibrio phage vB_VcorM_GR28A]|nr:hypothetical protein GR28A_00090 [Vibrio phage vB_VcorM_GR28A]
MEHILIFIEPQHPNHHLKYPSTKGVFSCQLGPECEPTMLLKTRASVILTRKGKNSKWGVMTNLSIFDFTDEKWLEIAAYSTKLGAADAFELADTYYGDRLPELGPTDTLEQNGFLAQRISMIPTVSGLFKVGQPVESYSGLKGRVICTDAKIVRGHCNLVVLWEQGAGEFIEWYNTNTAFIQDGYLNPGDDPSDVDPTRFKLPADFAIKL